MAYNRYRESANVLARKTIDKAKNIRPKARVLAKKTVDHAKNIKPRAKAIAKKTIDSAKKIGPNTRAIARKTLDHARKIAPNGRILARKIRQNSKKIAFWIIIAGLIGILIFYLGSLFEPPRDVAIMIRSLGFLGPVVVITIIALEVIIAPIPGGLITIGAGYAFGTLWGTILTYTGNIIGTSISFFLAHRFGRPFVEKHLNKEKMVVYDYFFKEYGKSMLWFAFILPVFPTDLITFATGLSDIKWKDFMLIACIAYIPNMIILNYFGATLFKSGFGRETTLLGLAILAVLLFGLTVYAYLKKKAVHAS